MIWIGSKYSDVEYGRKFFARSLTLFGPNNEKNRSLFCGKSRENYNAPSFNPQGFYSRCFEEVLDEDPSEQFMFYNPLHTYFYNKEIQQRCPCTNASTLLEFLDTKSETRIWATKLVPVVPFEVQDGSNLLRNMEESHEYIIQEEHSAGGFGTMLFHERQEEKFVFASGKKYIVSRYYRRTIPVNVNIIVYDDDILILPPSVQLIKEYKGKLLYLGADFSAFKQVSPALKKTLKQYSYMIGRQLHQMGYRGIAGIDYLLTEDEALFLEINARFQASSFLLDDILSKSGLPTIFELNLDAFKHKNSPQIDLYTSEISKSCLAYIAGTEQNVIAASRRNLIPEHEVDLYWDGYTADILHEDSAYLFRCVFSENICDVSPENQVSLHPNLIAHSQTQQEQVMKGHPIILKISLLNQGITMSENAHKHAEIIGLRKGTNSAIDLLLGEDMVVNCPVDTKYVRFSPFHLEFDLLNGWSINYYGRIIKYVNVYIDTEQGLRTKSGLPFSSCSFFATDRVRLHHTNICIYKQMEMGCLFCDASINYDSFDMDDLEDVIIYYSKHPRARHFLIGGGSSLHEKENERILHITKTIRKFCDKDIYVMCLPPDNKDALEKLYHAGVTQISFSIEFFDRNLAARLMPGKGEIPLEQYLTALRWATEIWGKSGNVRALVIVGLESKESVLEGIRTICSIGVQPILSAFRPLANTPMQSHIPPSNEWLCALYWDASAICESYGQRLGPDCSACQNNTIALPKNR